MGAAAARHAGQVAAALSEMESLSSWSRRREAQPQPEQRRRLARLFGVEPGDFVSSTR